MTDQICPRSSFRGQRGSKGRYVLRSPGGDEAEMTFSKVGEHKIIIDHTEVPDAFRGQGAGLQAGHPGGRGYARGGQEDHPALPVRQRAVPPPQGMGGRAEDLRRAAAEPCRLP